MLRCMVEHAQGCCDHAVIHGDLGYGDHGDQEVTGTLGMFNVALAHGKAGVTGSCIPFSRRRRWSFGTRRVAMVTIMRVCTVECGCGGIVIRNWGRVIEDDALCGIRFPEGFLVPGQEGNPVRRTSRAVLSGAGTLRFFYVACDHGGRDAMGGL